MRTRRRRYDTSGAKFQRDYLIESTGIKPDLIEYPVSLKNVGG